MDSLVPLWRKPWKVEQVRGEPGGPERGKARGERGREDDLGGGETVVGGLIRRASCPPRYVGDLGLNTSAKQMKALANR